MKKKQYKKIIKFWRRKKPSFGDAPIPCYLIGFCITKRHQQICPVLKVRQGSLVGSIPFLM